MEILALSGSLRAASSNTELLRAASALAPAGIIIRLYDGLGGLPHFNPDLDDADLPPVADFRHRLRAADGILISSPEYAHSLPGVLKNALDWVVGSGELSGKPIALLNASIHSHHIQEVLAEILTTMDALLVRPALLALPLRGKAMTEEGILADPTFSTPLREALKVFAESVLRQQEARASQETPSAHSA